MDQRFWGGVHPRPHSVQKRPPPKLPESGKPVDFSQTRTAVPIAARQSVQYVPVMACTLGVGEAESTSQERSQTNSALKIERDHRAAPNASDFSPMTK